MKIFKGRYGWETLAFSRNQDGSECKVYVETQFPKGEEPFGENIEGDLIFKTKDGKEKRCFLSCYQKRDGSTPVKLVFLKETKFIEQTTLREDNRDLLGHINNNKVVIEDELPFDEDDLPF